MKLLHIGGGHQCNVSFIRRACALYNIEYHHTANTNFPDNSYDIIWAPLDWIDPDRYPQSKILFGPHFFVFPDPSHPLFTRMKPEHASRCVYLCLSDWNVQVHKQFISQPIIPFVAIPFGLDIPYKPKATEMEYDCILYYKARHPSHLDQCIQEVQKRGLRYKIYRYGSYERNEYLDTLRKTRFVIWIGSHESQGFGFEECLATGTPIYTYDVISMKDEYVNSSYLYSHIPYPLYATSAPYWDERCGLKVYSIDELKGRFDEFIAALPTYRPADYVSETLTDRVCFQRFLDVCTPS